MNRSPPSLSPRESTATDMIPFPIGRRRLGANDAALVPLTTGKSATVRDRDSRVRVLPIAISVDEFQSGPGRTLAQHAPSLALLHPRPIAAITDLGGADGVGDGPQAVLLDCHNARGPAMCRAVARVRSAGWNGPLLVIVAQDSLARVPIAMSLGATEFALASTPATEIEVRLQNALFNVPKDRTVTTMRLPNGSHLGLHWRTHEITCDDICVSLPPRELQLIGALAERVGQTLTADEIGRFAWGKAHASERGMTVSYICSLRKRLAWFGDRFGIRTIRGTGYRFEISTVSLSALPPSRPQLLPEV